MPILEGFGRNDQLTQIKVMELSPNVVLLRLLWSRLTELGTAFLSAIIISTLKLCCWGKRIQMASRGLNLGDSPEN